MSQSWLLLSQPTLGASQPRSVFTTAIVLLRNAVQHAVMSMSQAPMIRKQTITPPSSFAGHPLTPPPTDEKRPPQVHQVLTLFKEIRAGKHIKRDSWTEFHLAKGDYAEIERQLSRNKALLGYVKDKIRYDYDAIRYRLVIRMPTAVHELFIARVEDDIFSQLKSFRKGSNDVATFAQKVHPARSTEIYLPVDGAPPGTKSKHEPDTSFWHEDAKYPGVIIEVAYSQKSKKLDRLAEDYLLDSNASIQVVVGLDIEYRKKRSPRATLSVWRAHVVGNELRVVQVVNEVFRDEQGNSTEHRGLRLRPRDFANKELAPDESDLEVVITNQQLCEYLDAAETKVSRLESLSENRMAPGLTKRRRSETPPDQINSDDEAMYVGQEKRAAKRVAKDDPDYQDASTESLLE